jgi:hypothetical protein
MTFEALVQLIVQLTWPQALLLLPVVLTACYLVILIVRTILISLSD